MKISFSGEVELPFADDRGSYDHWLIAVLKQVIDEGPETDDIFVKLKLHWTVKD